MAAHDTPPGSRVTDEPYQYWAFISYSHADTVWAKWLHRALERYRIPARLVGRTSEFGPIPKKLFPVFRDRDELAGSAELGPELQKALRRSRFQIVIASPNSARSRWVNEEIKFFKSLGRSSRVLALIVDGEPNAGDARECFPEALRFQVGTDGALEDRPAELIAADARKHADGKSNAQLKLIAGILGLGFNDLRQRELAARNRRLVALTSVATAISGITLALAIVAINARNDAQRRQQQAEDLLQFMLGDLRDKLEPIGKLSILDAVGKKAMDYFATLDQADLTDTALSSRATALRQIGTVRIKQGDLAGASAALGEALKLDEELVHRHPNEAAFVKNVAESASAMGIAHWERGEAELARPWFEQYAKTANRLVALDPENPDSIHTAVEANMDVGAATFARHDLKAAEAAFTIAIERQKQALKRTPRDRAAIVELADLNGWVCTVEIERNAWPAALNAVRQQVELLRQLVEAAPDVADYRYDLAASTLRMLRTRAHIETLQPDAPELRETLRVTQELVELDPENVEFANLRVVALEEFLAEANLGADQLHAAESAAREGLELARRTYHRASANAQAGRGLLLALTEVARVSVLQKDRPAALARLREVHDLPLPTQPDSAQSSLRLDAGLLEWSIAAGTAAAAEARARVEEAVKRITDAGGQVKPELMARYQALAGGKPALAR